LQPSTFYIAINRKIFWKITKDVFGVEKARKARVKKSQSQE